MSCVALGWVGLGWLGWVGLKLSLVWIGCGWVGVYLRWIRLDWVGLGWIIQVFFAWKKFIQSTLKIFETST